MGWTSERRVVAVYLRPDEQAQRTALAGACRQRPVGTASKAQKSNPRKAVKSLQRSYMGLGRVELPTSRLSVSFIRT